MAQVSVDFSDDFSFYQEVLFQRGKVVIDGELNEIGRLQRVAAYRSAIVETAQANVENIVKIPTITSGFYIQTQHDNGALGPNDIRLVPNVSGEHERTIFKFRGYVWEFTDSITIDLGAYTGGGAIEFQQLYVIIREVEVDSAGDPNIKVSALEETAVRVKLDVSYVLGSIDDGFAAFNDDNPTEPWQGTQRAGIIAHIVRDSVSSLRHSNIHFKFRMPSENYIVNNSTFFRGPGSIRPSINIRSAGRAFISSDGLTLNLTSMSILMGFQAQNISRESMSAAIGLILVPMADWAPGDCLVLEIPSHPAGFHTDTISAQGDQWDVVYDTQPGPAEILLSVQRFADWGKDQKDVPPINQRDDLPNRFVLCAWLTDPANSLGGALKYDILFADGKYLNIEDDPNNDPAITKEGLVWGYGNDLIEGAIVPDVGIPSDETGYRSGIRRPTSEYMLLFSQKTSDIHGATIFTRFYAMDDNNLDIPAASGLLITEPVSGLAITVNARWNQVGTWNKEDAFKGASIFYFGTLLRATDKGPDGANSFIAQAHRDAAGSSSWANNDWTTSTVGVLAGAQTFWDDKGNIGAIAANNPRITQYGTLGLSGNRDLLEIALPNTRTLYMRTIPKAAISVNAFGAGTPVFEGDSWNGATIVTVPTGATPGHFDITLKRPMAGIHTTLVGSIDYPPNSLAIADRLELVSVRHNSVNVIEVYIYDHQGATWESWASRQFHFHLVMFGTN